MAVDDPVPEWGIADTLRSLGTRPSTFFQIGAALAPKSIPYGNTTISVQDKLAKLAAAITGAEDYGMTQQQAARMGRIAQQQNSPFAPFEPDTTTPGTPLPEGALGPPSPPTTTLGAPRTSPDAPQMYAQLLKDPGYIMQLGSKGPGAGFAGAADDLMKLSNQRSTEYAAAAAMRQSLIDNGYSPAEASAYAANLAKSGVKVPTTELYRTPEQRAADQYTARNVPIVGDIALQGSRADVRIKEGSADAADRHRRQLSQEDQLKAAVQAGEVDPNDPVKLRSWAAANAPEANIARALWQNDPVKVMRFYGGDAMADMQKGVPPGQISYVDGLTYDKDGTPRPVYKTVKKELGPDEITAMVKGAADTFQQMVDRGGVAREIQDTFLSSITLIRKLPPADIPTAVLGLTRDVAALIKTDLVSRENKRQHLSDQEQNRIANAMRGMQARIDKSEAMFQKEFGGVNYEKLPQHRKAEYDRIVDQTNIMRDAVAAIGSPATNSLEDVRRIMGKAEQDAASINRNPVAAGMAPLVDGKPVEHYLAMERQTPQWRNGSTAIRAQREQQVKALFEDARKQERPVGR